MAWKTMLDGPDCEIAYLAAKEAGINPATLALPGSGK